MDHASFFVSLTQADTIPTVQNSAVDDSFWAVVSHSGAVGLLTLFLLALFSVVAWGIIVAKWRTLHAAYQESLHFLETFNKVREFELIYQKSDALKSAPLAHIFRAAYVELTRMQKAGESGSEPGGLDSLERAMRRAALSELTRLENLLPFLATTGATAPFIGLFGTVWGIMKAFHDIGKMGSANLSTVAPGISEALIATAAGLVAAIPAVMAYNYFNAKIRVLSAEMENFQADFLNILKRKLSA